MNASTALARAVVEALVAGGVRDAVLAPGSRSGALALALDRADGAGLLRLHVRIDERSAGFLALGLCKGGHLPVPVVTTSGTAVAELHPAVLEAFHSGQPLVVLSADRPASLRGTGANQTTDQREMFGSAAVFDDVPPGNDTGATAAVDSALRRAGPTQVNLQFAEPLLPDDAEPPLPDPSDPAEASHLHRHADETGGLAPSRRDMVRRGKRTVMVAGDDAGPPARLLAQHANWPLLAEPTSGARTGTHAIRTHRLLLDTSLADRIERVVVTGHPTLSRPVTRLISRSDIEVISVRGRSGICTDPGRVAAHLDSLPGVEGAEQSDWLDTWRSADRELSARIDALAGDDHESRPLLLARHVAAAVPPGGLLVVGSSQPVRDLDVMASPYPAGERRLVIGNRGLAGIDGMVSTAIGAALARDSTRALAYVGDLTFLHDANGLLLGPAEPRPDLTIVVANDDGGSIFAGLESGEARYADSFERVFGTPVRVGLAELCAASRTPYRLIDDLDALPDVFAEPMTGIAVLEVRVPRSGRRRIEQRLRDLARDTVDKVGS